MTKLLVATVAVLACSFGRLPATPLRAQEPDSRAQSLERAEQAFAGGDYELASELFESLVASELTPEQERWIAFRLPDARWRGLAAAVNPAAGEQGLAIAGGELESFLQDSLAVGLRDRAWAEASESYADWLWQRRGSARFEAALTHYQDALDHWAAVGDDGALHRFFGILDKLVRPAWAPAAWRYGQRGEYLPLELSEQAWRLARTPEQRSSAALVLAMTLATEEQGPAGSARVDQLFRLARDASGPAAVQRDALLVHGQWLERSGPWIRGADGLSRRQSDPAAARALYEELLQRFPDSRSNPWIGIARERIATLARQELEVRIERDFLPGTRPSFRLRWRNLESVELSLHALDFDQTPVMKGADVMPWHWLEAIDHPSGKALHAWSYATQDDGRSRLEERELFLEPELAPGAYLLQARSGQLVRRALVNVSAISLVAKAAGRRVLTWVIGARDGRPVEGARVRVQSRLRNEAGVWSWNEAVVRTDALGLAWAELPESAVNAGLFVSATHAGQVASTASGSTFSDPPMLWRFFASTDRPSHRPGQTLGWSLMARRQRDLETETPASTALDFRLSDASGQILESGQLMLDSYGCAQGAIDLPPNTAGGALRLELQDPAARRLIGVAPVGFIEEVPTPGPRVRVMLGVDPLPAGDSSPAPPLPARPVPARPVMGEMTEVVLEVLGSDGQPEAGAELEVVVEAHGWHARFPRMGRVAVVRARLRIGQGHRESGGAGRASTQGSRPRAARHRPPGTGAAVRLDGGSERTRTRARGRRAGAYGLRRSPCGLRTLAPLAAILHRSRMDRSHAVHAGESLEIGVEARDASGTPVTVSGRIQLLSLPASDSEGEWSEVQQSSLGTGSDGLARWSVTAPGEGAYLARWLAPDPRGGEVVAEVRFWAVERELPRIPRTAKGIQVLLERDSFEAGGAARAVLLAQEGISHVLLTLEADELIQAHVVDVSQGARLVPLALGQDCTPEVYLTAHSMSDGAELLDRREVVVVPTDRLLNVTADLESGSEGVQLLVRVRDVDQKPVDARVVLSLYSEPRAATEEAEQELDPRLFFVARPRLHQVQTRSSVDARPFAAERKGASQEGSEGQLGRPAEANKPARAHAAPDLRSAMERARARSKIGRPGNRKEFLVERRDEEAMDFEPAQGEKADLHARPQSEPILWQADAVTDADGNLRLPLSLPQAPFQGRLTLRVCDSGARFGFAVLPLGAGKED